MKELYSSHADELKVAEERPIRKAAEFRGRTPLRKGQTCYELNLATGEIKPAEYETVTAPYMSKASQIGFLMSGGTVIAAGSTHRKLMIREGCLYEIALNDTNAKRKFENRLAPFKK
jgi:hypothetical protein